jgi:hypothetical protein
MVCPLRGSDSARPAWVYEGPGVRPKREDSTGRSGPTIGVVGPGVPVGAVRSGRRLRVDQDGSKRLGWLYAVRESPRQRYVPCRRARLIRRPGVDSQSTRGSLLHQTHHLSPGQRDQAKRHRPYAAQSCESPPPSVANSRFCRIRWAAKRARADSDAPAAYRSVSEPRSAGVVGRDLFHRSGSSIVSSARSRLGATLAISKRRPSPATRRAWIAFARANKSVPGPTTTSG